MNLLEQGICLEEALLAYDFGGTIVGAVRYGSGHINDTFCVYTQTSAGETLRYILQRINGKVFKDVPKLMENIIGVTNHLCKIIKQNNGDVMRETMTVLLTKEGAAYFTDSAKVMWRVYRFVEGTVCLQRAETPDLFQASAKAFGRFQKLLADYPVKQLHETIYKFHDTRNRLNNFKIALEADLLGRAAEIKPEIDFVLAREKECHVLMDLLEKGDLPLRVTHNDTKLNNVLIDKQTRQGICIIDLDTVMPGLLANDFGDSIRFGANHCAEDEADLSKVNFSLSLFEAYTESFLSEAGSAMTKTEKECLVWGAKLMTLECGIRFLTDYIEGDVYFKTHRPKQNLDRTRTQFKLVADMENNWEKMQTIVAKY